MDALGHVNNAKYFSYFEEARIEYMFHLGFETVTQKDLSGPILANISCDFLRPIVFPDTLTIGTGVIKIGRSSMQMDYEIYSKQQDTIVARGTSVLVMMNYKEGKSIPVSDDIKSRIISLDPQVVF